MKNLTRRNKTLLAIAGVVVVVVVAGLLVFMPGEPALFGGDVIHISPQNPTINVQDQIDLSINSVGTCSWSSSNTNVVDINYFNPDKSRQVTMWGVGPGQATIKANCWMNRYTTITVRTPPQVTFNPPPVNGLVTVHVGQGETATVGTTGTDCHWIVDCGRCSWYAQNAVSFNPTTGPTTAMTGVYAGYSTMIKAVCFNGYSTGNSQIKVVP
jgi:hypothetical protein